MRSVENLKDILKHRDQVAANPFGVAKDIAAHCNRDPCGAAARELVIRALEHGDLFLGLAGMLDSLIHSVGLFPYAAPDHLSAIERLGYEAHRPMDLTLNGQSIVFHRDQAAVYRDLMDGKSLVLSAPTSFGKSLVVDALISSGRYGVVVMIVPTIALVDETRRRLNRFKSTHKIVTHPDQPLGEKNILVMTQERAIERADIERIDLLIIDEFYKLDPPQNQDADRASALNHAFYKLHKISRQTYLLGPNIDGMEQEVEEKLGFTFRKTDFNTVVSEVHLIKPRPSKKAAFLKLVTGLGEPTLIYCKSPKQANDVVRILAESDATADTPSLYAAADWVAATYHPEWSLVNAMRRGVGLHHGRIPRALAQFMVANFDDSNLRFLVCTSSLIEGVNTAAKNVIVYENKVGTPRLDYFTFRNIQGRAARMRRHFIGQVYVFDEPPRKTEELVDIPVVSQGPSTPLGLLVQLEQHDLKEFSSVRVAHLTGQRFLSMATIRRNAHVDPDDQIELARYLEEHHARLQPKLTWRGPMPTWEQLLTCCELLFDHFVKTRRCNISSGRQLAFKLRWLSDARSSAAYIRKILAEDKNVKSVDAAVELAMEFRRNWAGYHAPRYLHALDLIQKEVFGRLGLAMGDYTVYASDLENLFQPSEIMSLDEYGLPAEIGFKLGNRIALGGGLDAAISSLRALDTRAIALSNFEREVIETCRGGL
jgi:hypothetical protein